MVSFVSSIRHLPHFLLATVANKRETKYSPHACMGAAFYKCNRYDHSFKNLNRQS